MSQIDVVGEEGVVGERLQLAEFDAIFANDYRSMIKESFQSGKHFFLAKILSRGGVHRSLNDDSSPVKNQMGNILVEPDHSHWFNAYGILKLLFQRKGDEFVGRWHEKHPIAPKNPLTNKRIIGEVEFYRI
jgi:hypothetical protein